MAQSTDVNPGWPEPSADARAHSARVLARVMDVIAECGGAIPFDEFMRLVLYEPGLGYYMAGTTKFGREGDFITAPEISPLFAGGLARASTAVLAALGEGGIVEFGAGSGRLAADLLRTLAEGDTPPEFYAIVEPSAELRQRQRERLRSELGGLAERVIWWERLPDDPVTAVVVCNEVVDAFPVKRFAVGDGPLLEQTVAMHADGLCLAWTPAGAALAAAFERLAESLPWRLPPGYESEINLLAAPWLAAVGRALRRGAVLVCDYGYPRHEYYHLQRSRGTLMCHYRHRAHANPLLLPGLQDITAFVDFSALADSAVAAGFDIAGFTTQAGFLVSTVAADEVTAFSGSRESLARTNAAKTLLLPGEMGERFKVLALGRSIDSAVPGFDAFDHRHRLLPTVSQ